MAAALSAFAKTLGEWWKVFHRAILTKIERIWFPFFVAVLIYSALVIFGLSQSNVLEALSSYAGDVARPWTHFQWFQPVMAIVAIATVGRALRHWSERLLRINPDNRAKSTRGKRTLVIILWAAPWLALVICFIDAAQLFYNQAGHWWSPFTLLAIIAAGMPIGFYFWSISESGSASLKRLHQNQTFEKFAGYIPIAIFVFAVLVLALPPGFWNIQLARWIGPIALLGFALAALVSMVCEVQVFGRRYRAPVFLLMVGWVALWSGLDTNDNHAVHVLGDRPPPKLISLAEAVAQWDMSKQLPSTTDPILIVSAEGGGIRAAYFTAVTLGFIADKCPKLANHIFAISGASGGSLGAAVYSAAVSLKPVPDENRCDFKLSGDESTLSGPYAKLMDEVFSKDHLSPVVARLLFPETLQKFLPFPIGAFDRQTGLEASVADAFHDAILKQPGVDPGAADLLNTSFYGIGPSPEKPSTPFLFLNTTSVEHGDRVVATRVAITAKDSLPARTFVGIAPSTDFSLVSMAGTSARFGYVSPTGHVMHDASKERLIDGGYFDNSGAITGLQIYDALRDGNIANGRRIYLLHIGNQPIHLPEPVNNAQKAKPPESTGLKSCQSRPEKPSFEGFDEYQATPRALNAVKQARDIYAVDQARLRINQTDPTADKFFLVQMHDRGLDIPLGWLLSPITTRELANQASSSTLCPGGTSESPMEPGSNAGALVDLARQMKFLTASASPSPAAP